MYQGKTIQIYLPDGNPRGIRIAEITSRTIQAMLIPRSMLDEAGSRDELRNVGVYFLIGASEDDSKEPLYIGEAEDCLTRLQQHNRSKDFWTHALVVCSKTQQFTKTHIKFMEAFCYKEAGKANRFELNNGNMPNEPHLSESMRADLMDNYETMKVLVSTLGYPFFDQIKKPRAKEILVCQWKDLYAEGEYSEEGFVVFAGAKCRLDETRAINNAAKKIRKTLLRKEILTQLEETDTYLTLGTDHIFKTPSAAACFVLGRSANGWTEWKYKDGRTLDEVKRSKPEGQEN